MPNDGQATTDSGSTKADVSNSLGPGLSSARQGCRLSCRKSMTFGLLGLAGFARARELDLDSGRAFRGAGTWRCVVDGARMK